YIEPEVHKKILPAFHYALKPDGFLFLGASESIGSFTTLFDNTDRQQKIFARKNGLSATINEISSGRTGSGRTGSGRTGSGRTGSGRTGSGRTGSGRTGSEPGEFRPNLNPQ